MTLQDPLAVAEQARSAPAATSGTGRNSGADSCKSGYVTPGMPPLKQSRKTVSFFEFWPTWAMYLPVGIQWLLLSVYYRSLTLPLIANPKLKLSGMVGVPKSELLSQATGHCEQAILPWFTATISAEPIGRQTATVINRMQTEGFQFPIVGKPDIGCRGSGVRLLKDADQLRDYLAAYPVGASIMLQQVASHEPEAGVFFIREPNSQEGRIISLALKYTPYVVGNGQDTLARLIANDARASGLQHLYLERHRNRLADIIPAGQPFKLVFSASHCRGAIFKNAEDQITPELTASLNRILADLPEFHYGRLDIKFPDVESLRAGKGLEIVEINTASSEPLHIWDSDAQFGDAIGSLLFQYRMLFKLGSQNRNRGYKTPGIRMLLRHWRKEKALHEFYPATD